MRAEDLRVLKEGGHVRAKPWPGLNECNKKNSHGNIRRTFLFYNKHDNAGETAFNFVRIPCHSHAGLFGNKTLSICSLKRCHKATQSSDRSSSCFVAFSDEQFNPAKILTIID